MNYFDNEHFLSLNKFWELLDLQWGQPIDLDCYLDSTIAASPAHGINCACPNLIGRDRCMMRSVSNLALATFGIANLVKNTSSDFDFSRDLQKSVISLKSYEEFQINLLKACSSECPNRALFSSLQTIRGNSDSTYSLPKKRIGTKTNIRDQIKRCSTVLEDSNQSEDVSVSYGDFEDDVRVHIQDSVTSFYTNVKSESYYESSPMNISIDILCSYIDTLYNTINYISIDDSFDLSSLKCRNKQDLSESYESRVSRKRSLKTLVNMMDGGSRSPKVKHRKSLPHSFCLGTEESSTDEGKLFNSINSAAKMKSLEKICKQIDLIFQSIDSLEKLHKSDLDKIGCSEENDTCLDISVLIDVSDLGVNDPIDSQKYINTEIIENGLKEATKKLRTIGDFFRKYFKVHESSLNNRNTSCFG